MSAPPRYSLDEEEQFISGTGKVQNAEDHPLLHSEHGDHDAKRDGSGIRIDTGFGSAGRFNDLRDDSGPSGSDIPIVDGEGGPRRAIYGKLTTLYTFHPLYIINGTTETCINVLGKDRQDTLRILRRAFPVLDDYPDERIQLKVSRAAMGIGEAARSDDAEGESSSGTIPAPADFDFLYWYPPESDETTRHLHGLVEIMDDAWTFLRQVPPGRVRVFIRPTEEQKYKAWRYEKRGEHIFLGILLAVVAAMVLVGAVAIIRNAL